MLNRLTLPNVQDHGLIVWVSWLGARASLKSGMAGLRG
jgi:hypothetical protein